MRIRITARQLDVWRSRWPCSTLATGWLELDDGDLIDMGGVIARADVDNNELQAFLENFHPKAVTP